MSFIAIFLNLDLIKVHALRFVFRSPKSLLRQSHALPHPHIPTPTPIQFVCFRTLTFQTTFLKIFFLIPYLASFLQIEDLSGFKNL